MHEMTGEPQWHREKTVARVHMAVQRNYPLRDAPYAAGERECVCSGCRASPDHLHWFGWHTCDACSRRIWFNGRACKLYAWRIAASTPQLICFDCRWPFHQEGMSSGDIHRRFRWAGAAPAGTASAGAPPAGAASAAQSKQRAEAQ
jgi:hypothetical protein